MMFAVRSAARSVCRAVVNHRRFSVAIPSRKSPLPAPPTGVHGPHGGPRNRRQLCAGGTGGGPGGGGGSKGMVGTGGPGEPQPGGLAGAWNWYLSCLETQPLLTKAISAALLNALGDILCQTFIEKGPYSASRTAIFTFIGLVLVGPTLHFWYNILSKLVPAKGAAGATMQLLLDQGAFAPVFLSVFIAFLFTIEGKPELIRPKLEQDLFETVKANWILWVPAQYLNFRFVPLRLQVLTANVVALVWNVYMSFQSHKAVAPAAKH